jgi:hypothetical protein
MKPEEIIAILYSALRSIAADLVDAGRLHEMETGGEEVPIFSDLLRKAEGAMYTVDPFIPPGVRNQIA